MKVSVGRAHDAQLTDASGQHKTFGGAGEQIHQSPRQLMQRQRMHALFGDIAQLPKMEGEEPPVQCVAASELEEDAPLQGELGAAALPGRDQAGVNTVRRENSTGMPDQLKANMEAMSGYDLSDVRVHRNSEKPAQLSALAYAQGKEIHLGPGQERHLPHEVWHIVQQKQGRVRATRQMRGVRVNDDAGLEREADVMGERSAETAGPGVLVSNVEAFLSHELPVQGMFDISKGFKREDAIAYIRMHIGDIRRRFGGFREKGRLEGKPLLEYMAVIKDLERASEDQIHEIICILNTMEGQIEAAETEDRAEINRAMEEAEEERKENERRGKADKKNSKANDRIKIGTEFTFVHAVTKGKRIKNLQQAAKDLIPQWRNKVSAVGCRKGCALTTREEGGKANNACVFEYKNNGATIFWWKLDIDDGCFETQTMPCTIGSLKSVEWIISGHIFEVAESLEFEVDVSASGGGGHISLDSTTAFGDDAELMLSTVEAMQRGFSQWTARMQDEDAVNAPFYGEQKHGDESALECFQRKVPEWLGRIRNGSLSWDDLLREISDFNRSVTNPAIPKGGDDQSKEIRNRILGNRDHYQAINLEHMASNQGAGRRLELRRIPAQQGLAKLMSDLEYVFSILTAVRGQVSAGKPAGASSALDRSQGSASSASGPSGGRGRNPGRRRGR